MDMLGPCRILSCAERWCSFDLSDLLLVDLPSTVWIFGDVEPTTGKQTNRQREALLALVFLVRRCPGVKPESKLLNLNT